jgi:tRNA(Ile)-lysidine synthase
MTATGARSPAAGSPPPELVARFSEALERLWPQGGRLGLAVSGGPDSLAMLLLAEAAIPGRFEVATVDHGLRPEAADECALVAEVCAARQVPCETLRVTVQAGNLQSRAREARYEALMDWAEVKSIDAIATGHHADDQTETLLMRLNRGSGIAGLSGVRERSSLDDRVPTIIRPLLGFRRSELASLVQDAGLVPVEDPSNLDERFDRARIRKALAEVDWIDPIAVARSAALLAEAKLAIDLTVEDELIMRVSDMDGSYLYYAGHPSHFIEVELVTRIITRFGGTPEKADVARLVDRLREGKTGNIAGVQVRPIKEVVVDDVESERWVFRPEPPRRLH